MRYDRSQPMSSASRHEGFTLVEVVFGLSFLLFAVVFVGLGINTGSRVSREIRDLELVQTQAQAFTDTMLAQPYGAFGDGEASTDQLDEIFDNDNDPGDVTMFQLRNSTSASGVSFALSGSPVAGTWMVQVDNDINDDDVIAGTLETGDEVFRIRVFFNGDLIMRTFRATDVTT